MSSVDIIIACGANVFPAEVERALIDHPKIADIVVVGLRDPEWGRRVHAIIEPTDPAHPPSFDEVRSYTKSRMLTYKVPKSIEIVEAIPRSAATKVNAAASSKNAAAESFSVRSRLVQLVRSTDAHESRQMAMEIGDLLFLVRVGQCAAETTRLHTFLNPLHVGEVLR